jgi:hypothetical protein
MDTNIACAALVLAACTPAASPKPVLPGVPASPPSVSVVEGLYRAPHNTRYRCDEAVDGWCNADVEDLMAISDHGGGILGVHVLIAGINAHTCRFAGDFTADRSPTASTPRWVFHDQEHVDPCTLALEKATHGLELHADGCRTYCGANAYLDASFTLQD